MEKVNGVYVANTAIVGGGMKGVEKTPHEAKKLNSEIRRYDISTFYKPTTYEIFSTWPDDIKRNYLYNCYWKHHGSTTEIADMLGVTHKTVRSNLQELDIPMRKRGEKRSDEDKNAWARFLLRGTKLGDLLPEDLKEKIAVVSAPVETPSDPVEEICEPEVSESEEETVQEPSEVVEETRTETYHVDLDDRFATLAALLTQLKGSGTEVNIKIVI